MHEELDYIEVKKNYTDLEFISLNLARTETDNVLIRKYQGFNI